MKRTIMIFGIVCLAGTWPGLSVRPAGAQTARPSMSADEFLEYSLEALRTRMDDAVSENRQTSARNTSIRNRVLFLREEMRAMDDELLQLREEAVDLRNAIRMDAEELKLEEKQLNTLLERKRNLSFERDMIKKRMETTLLERGMLEQGVNEASVEVRELSGSAKRPAKSQLLSFFAEEKLKYLDMIKASQIRNADRQTKIESQEMLIDAHLRAKETSLREQERMKGEVSELELLIKEEQARSWMLKREEDRARQDIKGLRSAVEQEILAKKEYSGRLAALIREFKSVQKDIQSRFAGDEKMMKRHLAFLNDENQVLFQKHNELQRGSDLERVKSEEEHTTLMVSQQRSAMEEQKRGELNALAGTRGSIEEQKNVNTALARDEDRLQKEIADLASRIEAVKKTASVIRKDAFGEKRAELDKAFARQDTRVQRLEKSVQSAEEEARRHQDRLRSVSARGEDLVKDLRDREADLAALRAAHAALLEEYKELSRMRMEKTASYNNGIAEARLCKKAMEGAYEVIQKKYQAGAYEARAFEAEQAELTRYLDVLQRENTSLQKRLRDLSQSR